MRNVICILSCLAILVIGSPVLAELTQQQQEEMFEEVMLICIEKLKLENIPVTKDNIKKCGADQIQGGVFTAAVINKIDKFPAGKEKDILKGITVSCFKENQLPSGALDYYEVGKCISIKMEVLDYIIKKY